MGFEKFNPFKKDRQNFPGVVIPLAGAPTHSPSLTEKDDKETKSLDLASSSENGAAGSQTGSTLTLEALRAEIESDVATATHDSAYDRMSFPPKTLFARSPKLHVSQYLGSWLISCRQGEGDQ
jgi:hypothetical protein